MNAKPRKTVLVSGGTRGIGRAIVSCLVAEGWNVAFTYRSDRASAKELRDELAASSDPGQTIRPYLIDLADSNAVRTLPSVVAGDFGRLDALVNNAGLTDDGTFLSMDRARWQHVLSTKQLT